jgi:hypothetical protein
MIKKRTDADKLKAFLAQFDEKMLLIDGHENAFMGIINDRTNGYVAVYSTAIIIDNLMRDDMMDYETAEEFVLYNIVNAYVGTKTPLFLDVIPKSFWK